MTPVLDDWTIVIVGSWNVAILNPEWLGPNVFGQAELELELLIGPARPQIKVAAPLVAIVPEPGRVVLNARQTTDESVFRTAAVAARLLEKLPETPITGIGINFAFVETNVRPELATLFQIRDTGRISDQHLVIKSTTIVRQLEYNGRDLNLKLTQEDKLSFHFNYHKNVISALAAKEAIEGKVLLYKEHAIGLMRSLFNLDLEEQGA